MSAALWSPGEFGIPVNAGLLKIHEQEAAYTVK
jgi:hypothetical protein